jgi:uroporphyrinogen-III decarboxylase
MTTNALPAQHGRTLALQALSGHATERTPVALFTWGFDYYYKLADLQPWQLAFGSHATCHHAHKAIYARHRPDVIFYDGAGGGPNEPTLLRQTPDAWYVLDNNSGVEYELLKDSLAVREAGSGRKGADPVGRIQSRADVDRLIPLPGPLGQPYLDGLARLIAELGDEALVLPHDSPAYIMACYAFGFEPAMEAMLEAPALFDYACERLASATAARMRQLAGAGAEAAIVVDSWASCDIISPALFERFALPHQRLMIEAARDAGLKVILWNPGDIRPILQHEAALPIDAFAWEQPRKGIAVSIEQVREVFGPGRCLWGNLDSELLLWRNDPREIRAAVADQLRSGRGPGRGAPFILCQGSPIPSNIDPSAVDTMIAACRMGC